MRCLNCDSLFTPRSGQRHCSKRCWYTWHRGPNNRQWRGAVSVTCGTCAVTFEKPPYRVRAANYCYRACAHAAHGAKITGDRHPNWKGGLLDWRGSLWKKQRVIVLHRQGHQCIDCGLTQDTHRARYGSGLQVHHVSPFRLSLDSSPDNLVALCAPCHAREEKATRDKLPPEAFAVMIQRTKEMRALGFERPAMHMYDLCDCGAPKAKHSAKCRKCRTAIRRAHRLPHFTCPICGGPKSTAVATRCWPCRVSSS